MSSTSLTSFFCHQLLLSVNSILLSSSSPSVINFSLLYYRQLLSSFINFFILSSTSLHAAMKFFLLSWSSLQFHEVLVDVTNFSIINFSLLSPASPKHQRLLPDINLYILWWIFFALVSPAPPPLYHQLPTVSSFSPLYSTYSLEIINKIISVGKRGSWW